MAGARDEPAGPSDVANPYAPTATPSDLLLPGSAGIELGERRVPFSGTLRRSEVIAAIGHGRALWWYAMFALLMMLQLSLTVTGGVFWPGMLSLLGLVYVLPLAMLGLMMWLQSAPNRARQMLSRHPRMLSPTRGYLSAQRIYVETADGWSEIGWGSIMGIKIRANMIVLALNAQHANLIILPRSWFEGEDWAVVREALLPLAARLPFGWPSARVGTSAWLTSGTVPPLGEVPQGAIRMAGVLSVGEVLRSGYGRRMFLNWWVGVIVVTVICGGAVAMLWMWGGPVWVAWLFAVPPALMVLRMVRMIVAAAWGSGQPLLKLAAAVADEGIWLSTPRGASFSRWTAFGDVIVDQRIILLRETPRAISLTPLPRAALEDDADWDRLVRLVESRVDVGDELMTPAAAGV